MLTWTKFSSEGPSLRTPESPTFDFASASALRSGNTMSAVPDTTSPLGNFVVTGTCVSAPSSSEATVSRWSPSSVPTTAAVGHSVLPCTGAPTITFLMYSRHPPSSEGPRLSWTLRGRRPSCETRAACSSSLSIAAHIRRRLEAACNHGGCATLGGYHLRLPVERRLRVGQLERALDERLRLTTVIESQAQPVT